MFTYGILVAIIGLSLLIAVHELGHFIVGKLMGLKVFELMLGLPLGPKLVAVKRGETVYGISAVLFGGYVKFAELFSIVGLKISAVSEGSAAERAGFKKGDVITKINDAQVSDWITVYRLAREAGEELLSVEVERDGAPEVLNVNRDDFNDLAVSHDRRLLFSEIPRTYDAQKSWKKGLIVAAGPAMNIVFALLIVFFITWLGFPTPTNKMAKVLPKTPAAEAGIKAGDKIVAIDGKKVTTWKGITKIIQANPDRRVEVVVERSGRRLVFHPHLTSKNNEGLLGVMTKVERRRRSLGFAVGQSWLFVKGTTILLFKFFGLLVTTPGKVLPMVRSPIGIVKDTAPIARSSILDFLMTLAGLSIAIGIFNLLPLPPLDGGRLLISIVEGARRRPISKQAMIAVNAVGFSLLLILTTYAVIGDIFRKAIPG